MPIFRPAIGVEVCDCPPKYNSTSCQDPGLGFYRWHKQHFVTSEIVIDLVGEAKRCQCNGRTNKCHPETGECLVSRYLRLVWYVVKNLIPLQDCGENTAGPHCDSCATGFYGNPNADEPCLPCQCPSADKNYARTCTVNSRGQFSCQCRMGYTGPKCDR